MFEHVQLLNSLCQWGWCTDRFNVKLKLITQRPAPACYQQLSAAGPVLGWLRVVVLPAGMKQSPSEPEL